MSWKPTGRDAVTSPVDYSDGRKIEYNANLGTNTILQFSHKLIKRTLDEEDKET